MGGSGPPKQVPNCQVAAAIPRFSLKPLTTAQSIPHTPFPMPCSCISSPEIDEILPSSPQPLATLAASVSKIPSKHASVLPQATTVGDTPKQELEQGVLDVNGGASFASLAITGPAYHPDLQQIAWLLAAHKSPWLVFPAMLQHHKLPFGQIQFVTDLAASRPGSCQSCKDAGAKCIPTNHSTWRCVRCFIKKVAHCEWQMALISAGYPSTPPCHSYSLARELGVVPVPFADWGRLGLVAMYESDGEEEAVGRAGDTSPQMAHSAPGETLNTATNATNAPFETSRPRRRSMRMRASTIAPATPATSQATRARPGKLPPAVREEVVVAIGNASVDDYHSLIAVACTVAEHLGRIANGLEGLLDVKRSRGTPVADGAAGAMADLPAPSAKRPRLAPSSSDDPYDLGKDAERFPVESDQIEEGIADFNDETEVPRFVDKGKGKGVAVWPSGFIEFEHGAEVP